MSFQLPAFMRQQSTYEALIKSGEPLWVVNNTEPRGLLICTINDPMSGKPQKHEFQRTWVPFCLTEMLPIEVLQKSIEIRRLISKGLLKIIPHEEAMSMLSTPEGQREYERLMQSEFSKGSRMTDRKSEMLDTEQSVAAQKITSNTNPGVDYTQVTLHPKVQAWEMRVSVGELDGPSLMNEIRIHQAEFTRQDFEFMRAGQFPSEVKEYSNKSLTEGKFKKDAPVTAANAGQAKDNVSYESDWQVG